MPSYFSYIGELNSPEFFWNDIPDDKFKLGNTPERIVPKGFSISLGLAPEMVSHWSKKAGLEGKQLDWGAWGMMVRKSDLESIWKEAREQGLQDQNEWQKFWEEIEALQDGEMYVLVIGEKLANANVEQLGRSKDTERAWEAV